MASDTWVDPVTGNYMQEREDGSVWMITAQKVRESLVVAGVPWERVA